MLVTLSNVSHTSQCYSNFSMLVTLPTYTDKGTGTRTRGAERPEVLVYLNIGYPNTYDNDLSVSIPIEVTSGSKIELTFLDMDIENASTCEYDYLQGGHHYFLYNIFFNMFVFSF